MPSTCDYFAGQTMTGLEHIMSLISLRCGTGKSGAPVALDFNKIALYLFDAVKHKAATGDDRQHKAGAPRHSQTGCNVTVLWTKVRKCNRLHDTRHHAHTGTASTTLYKPLVWCTVFRWNPVSCKSWLNSCSVRSFPSTATSMVMSSRYFTDRSVMP